MRVAEPFRGLDALPPELWLIIDNYIAGLDRGDLTRLVRVSRSTNAYWTPRIYKTINIESKKMLRVFLRLANHQLSLLRTFSSFAASVLCCANKSRKLTARRPALTMVLNIRFWFDYGHFQPYREEPQYQHAIEIILTACTSLKNMWVDPRLCQDTPVMLETYSRVASHARMFYPSYGAWDREFLAQTIHPVRITHLYMSDMLGVSVDLTLRIQWQAPHFPCLTHLAIGCASMVYDDPSRLNGIGILLNRISTLQRLVCLIPSPRGRPRKPFRSQQWTEFAARISDERVFLVLEPPKRSTGNDVTMHRWQLLTSMEGDSIWGNGVQLGSLKSQGRRGQLQ
ncbi:hypothetical protein BKA62DRAFT_712682 [Auriculariales sp. MPI-PUGE-AT-0066]|nr:hypothetical protein BKA62DRAFT_712682 [Auriculariales sp. MPI-PUGE-AT-0066]